MQGQGALRDLRKNFLTSNLRLVKKNCHSKKSTALSISVKITKIVSSMPYISPFVSKVCLHSQVSVIELFVQGQDALRVRRKKISCVSLKFGRFMGIFASFHTGVICARTRCSASSQKKFVDKQSETCQEKFGSRTSTALLIQVKITESRRTCYIFSRFGSVWLIF